MPSPMTANFRHQMQVGQPTETASHDESIHRLHLDHRINALAFKNTNDSNITVAVGSMSMERDNNKVEIY